MLTLERVVTSDGKKEGPSVMAGAWGGAWSGEIVAPGGEGRGVSEVSEATSQSRFRDSLAVAGVDINHKILVYRCNFAADLRGNDPTQQTHECLGILFGLVFEVSLPPDSIEGRKDHLFDAGRDFVGNTFFSPFSCVRGEPLGCRCLFFAAIPTCCHFVVSFLQCFPTA